MLDIYPKGKKILIIGPKPPPLGGVSVHVSRLYSLLRKNGYQVDLFDLSNPLYSKRTRNFRLFIRLVWKKPDVIHVQALNLKILRLLYHMKRVRNFSLFITDHNPRFFKTRSRENIEYYKKILGVTDLLVVVGDVVLNEYKSNVSDLPKKVLVRNAFIPPPLEDEGKILATYSRETLDFVASHKPVITANAYKIVFFEDTDLYGLDMCIELTAMLKKMYRNVGFLFALADGNENRDYIKKMQDRIKELGIEDNFHFLAGQKELWPLFKKSDLMIRPTSTDGYPISIAEAFFCGCPAIASDVCQRPEGTILVKKRDLNDLFNTCKNVLRQLGEKQGLQNQK